MIMRNAGWGGQCWWSVATVFNLIGRSPRFPEGITNLLFLVQIQFGVVVAEFDQDLQNQVIHGGHIHFGEGIDVFLGFFVGHMRYWVGRKILWIVGWGGQYQP